MQNLFEILGDQETDSGSFSSNTMLVDTVVPWSSAATSAAAMPVSSISCWIPARIPTD